MFYWEISEKTPNKSAITFIIPRTLARYKINRKTF
jgi:hypothetical protein